MTIDPRLVEKPINGTAVRTAIKNVQKKGRLKLRAGLKIEEACRIVDLALQVGKRDVELRAAARRCKDPLDEQLLSAQCSEKLRVGLRSQNAKLERLIRAYLNRGANTASPTTPIEPEFLVVPIMAHAGCDEPEARSTANDLMRGLAALTKLASAQPRPNSAAQPKVTIQLVYAWIDLFGDRPGKSNDARAPFNVFVADLVGCAPAARLRDFIASLEDDAVLSIQEIGYPKWIIGRRELYSFLRSP